MCPVSSPPHLHCIYVSHFHCRWQCWLACICCGSFHDCIHAGRLVLMASLIVWHSASATLLARFDRSFVASIEYSCVLHCPSEVTPKVSEVLCQSWPTLLCYYVSLPSTMTTTGSPFFSFQLPCLCGSGAYVFSSDNRNSRIDMD